MKLVNSNSFYTASGPIESLWPLLCWINSLWPSNTIWRHKSGSKLAHVIACCLTAPSHYLKQCWLIISKVQLHSSGCNFTRDVSAISHWNWLENHLSKFLFKSPWGQWVNFRKHSMCLHFKASFIFEMTQVCYQYFPRDFYCLFQCRDCYYKVTTVYNLRVFIMWILHTGKWYAYVRDTMQHTETDDRTMCRI